MSVSILTGDVRTVLAGMAGGSVQMVATSPPYWGLRDYSAEGQLGAEPLHDCLGWARGDEPCGGCFVCNLREVARGLWRVLRDDGVMFLNLGDTMAASRSYQVPDSKHPACDAHEKGAHRVPPGLKQKDLCGVPWRVALALQADGWYLRSDIIWSKPNPMPESVRDRPTRAHEYVFLLTKRPRYFWDQTAVAEPSTYPGDDRGSRADSRRGTECNHGGGVTGATRNLRSVWTVPTCGFPGQHFAVWPPALVKPMILAGSSERGACASCGSPYKRVVERGNSEHHCRPGCGCGKGEKSGDQTKQDWDEGWKGYGGYEATAKDTGLWQKTCKCETEEVVPCVVLDPFAGSGTTLVVADALGRDGLGIELNPAYVTIATKRISDARAGHVGRLGL